MRQRGSFRCRHWRQSWGAIREVFDDIAGQAEKMYKAGIPAEEAQHRYIVPEKFKNFPVYAWGFTIGPAITKLYAEWGAK
jgi:hypothetical protein